MLTRSQKGILLAFLFEGLFASAAFAASAFVTRPDDPRAVHLAASESGARADGIADDTDAVQAAINQVRQGVAFVAPGRYRLTRTVFVPPGVRLFGYGPQRPVFVLGSNTPGFQKGVATMVLFSGRAVGMGGAPG